jgi:FAD/FMN-containing dehydrogenase
VLSVGGVGGASHRFGLVVDNVEALEVVTGRGEFVTCSPSERPGLFRAVLGGLGQFAVITKAKIQLQRAPTAVRVYELTYTDVNQYVADQRLLAHEQRFDSLGGRIVPAPSGPGFVLVLEGAAYVSTKAPDDSDLLAGLTPAAGFPPRISEVPYLAWLDRLGAFEQTRREAGLGETPHPWLDLFLPDRDVETFMAGQIARLTADDLGAGMGVLYPLRRPVEDRSSVVLPSGSELVWVFDLLRYPNQDPDQTAGLLADNRARFEQARGFGGKRYPISAIDFSEDDWRDHFGSDFARFARWKERFDPSNVLTPGQRIFSDRAPKSGSGLATV